MRTPQSLTKNDRSEILASRRGLLGTFAAAPVVFWAPTAGQVVRQLGGDECVARVERSLQGRELSRSRYHNAEGFFRGANRPDDRLDGERLYSFGIVIQLGLSAHLLDVGFDDQWCAKHIGLHVSRSYLLANATGLGLNADGFELLAASLSPYGKWRNCPPTAGLDFPFTTREIGSLVRLMLDHVRDVTGHPRPRVRGLSHKVEATTVPVEPFDQHSNVSEQALPSA